MMMIVMIISMKVIDSSFDVVVSDVADKSRCRWCLRKI